MESGALWLGYGGALILGLIHGSDPGHGWPIAVLKARSAGGVSRMLLYVWTLAAGHLASTVVVVGAVWLVGRAVEGVLAYLQLGAGVLLVVMGLRALLGLAGNGGHGLRAESGVLDMARYALVLGFAHEEELVLATIVLLGANPLLLSIAYGASVALAMTLWSLAVYSFIGAVSERLQARLEGLLEALTGVMLLAVGITAVWGAIS